jgi:biopolymer transport protein ExbD
MKPTVKEDVSCNLIPMVDIMFLLLLFFILGADMSQRESEDLVLPKADRIKEYPKEKDPTPTTTVNIHHRSETNAFSCAMHSAGRVCRDDSHWLLTIRSQDYTWETIAAQLKAEAEESLEPDVDPEAGVQLSKRKVIIRSDESAPYGYVRRLIELCGTLKIYKIEVGAAKPPVA